MKRKATQTSGQGNSKVSRPNHENDLTDKKSSPTQVENRSPVGHLEIISHLVYDELFKTFRNIILKEKDGLEKKISLNSLELEGIIKCYKNVKSDAKRLYDGNPPPIFKNITMNATQALRLKVNRFMGKTYIDIRLYYMCKREKDWRPLAKGVRVDMQTFEIPLKDLEFISNRISEECRVKEVAISVGTSLFLQSSIRQAITDNCEGCLNGSDNQIKHMMIGGCTASWEAYVDFFIPIELLEDLLKSTGQDYTNLNEIFADVIRDEEKIKHQICSPVENEMYTHTHTHKHPYTHTHTHTR